MKRFFKNITFYFIIPITVAGISMELLIRNIPNAYTYKKEYLDINSDSIKILILGASNAYNNINPDYLKERSFNAAYMAQSLNLDYEILKKYDQKWTKLKWIILPISYPSLYFRLENWIESWRFRNYTIYYHLPISHKITDYFEVLASSFRYNINRIIIYYIYNIKPAPDYTKLGWGTNCSYKTKEDLASTGKYWGTNFTFKGVPIDYNLNIVKSMINYASERNVRVFLFTEPVYHTYIENMDSNQISQTIKSAINLKNNYDNVVYVNFLMDSSFTERDFHDAAHLDEFGAQKLTLKIDSIITHLEKRSKSF